MIKKTNDGAGYILPAFIDMHCHLRDPGFTYKEDIASGTAAASAGGYGAVVCMPNTDPVIDNIKTLEYVKNTAAERGFCTVIPAAAVTVGQKGGEICDFETLAKAGAAAFSDDGRPVENSAVILEAMKRCAAFGFLIISHCEELSLSFGGAVNEGDVSRLLGVKGIPSAAEDIAAARDIILAEYTGCRLHIAHVSTSGSVRLVREAKARGVKVTAETCPHYFALNEKDVPKIGTNAKMNPPLRSRRDVEAIIEGLCDGTLDCISTDHAPHSIKEKNKPLTEAPNGIIGFQTAFAAAVTYLVKPGYMSLERLSELFTANPAKILGIKPPDKNVAVYPDKKFTFTEDMILSKSKNSPYIGRELFGEVYPI